MNDDILARISRMYAAIGAIEEEDPTNLKATVILTDSIKHIFQDFRGGLSDADLSNQAHTVIYNVSHFEYHLKKWAAHNGRDQAKVDQALDNSHDLQIIKELSNNDKHGYPPHRSRSGKYPQLKDINRVMKLQTQAKKGSMIAITIGAGGVPRFSGNGTAKAVVTVDVVDKENNRIGDLYDIATKAIEAWEQLLSDFGLIPPTNGT